MSEYDNRQFGLMLEQIKNFESKRIDLPHLINGLESLLCALEDTAETWKSEFRRNWAVLEEIYAIFLDRKKEIDANGWNQINVAILKIKEMVSNVYIQNEEGV